MSSSARHKRGIVQEAVEIDFDIKKTEPAQQHHGHGHGHSHNHHSSSSSSASASYSDSSSTHPSSSRRHVAGGGYDVGASHNAAAAAVAAATSFYSRGDDDDGGSYSSSAPAGPKPAKLVAETQTSDVEPPPPPSKQAGDDGDGSGSDDDGKGEGTPGKALPPTALTLYAPYDDGRPRKVTFKRASLPLITVYLTTFMQSMNLTVVLPTMLWYFQYLSYWPSSSSTSISGSLSGSTQATVDDGWMYGIDCSAYAGGQLVGVGLFAIWAAKQGNKVSILGGCAMTVAGCILYVCLPMIPGRPWAAHITMFIARFIQGIGAGNITPCRAYAAEVSPMEERNTIFSILNAAQGVGMLIAPLVGIMFYTVDFWVGPFLIDMNTWPGYMGIIFGIFNFILVLVTFKEVPIRPEPKDNKKKPLVNLPTIALIAIYTFVFYVLSVFECLGTAITQNYFDWTAAENGLLFGAVGVISVIIFALLSLKWVQKVDDRIAIGVGLFVLLACTMCMTCWYPAQVKDTLAQFCTGALLLGISYPVCLNSVLAVFSKLVPQSTLRQQMGWLGVAGCAARFVGPIIASVEWTTLLYDDYYGNGLSVFLTCTVLVLCSAVLLAIFWKKFDVRNMKSNVDETTPLVEEKTSDDEVEIVIPEKVESEQTPAESNAEHTHNDKVVEVHSSDQKATDSTPPPTTDADKDVKVTVVTGKD
ncbi:MFS general substrate transporter [Pelomyxa schiedti]|nr:MFS general substrate transporter [Pelomyxa schiedti]